MGSYNRVILIGHLGRDAELRYTPGGSAVATLSLATSESWSDKQGQKQERTEWHRIQVWGKTAEALSQYLTKGREVACEGKLQTRKWQDKDGVDRYTTEIRADRVVLIGGGRRLETHDEEPPAVASNDHQPPDDEDRIPFCGAVMAGRWTAESDRDYDDQMDRWREIVGCANCGTDTPRYEGVSRSQALCDACWAKAVTTQIQKIDRGVA